MLSIPLGSSDTIFFSSETVKDKYIDEEYKFTHKERLIRYDTGDIEQLTERQKLFAQQQNYKPSTTQSGKWYHQPVEDEKIVA